MKFKIIHNDVKILITLDEIHDYIKLGYKIDKLFLFTGIVDKNENDLYEDDQIKLYYKGKWEICTIVFIDGIFCLKWSDKYTNPYKLHNKSYILVE